MPGAAMRVSRKEKMVARRDFAHGLVEGLRALLALRFVEKIGYGGDAGDEPTIGTITCLRSDIDAAPSCFVDVAWQVALSSQLTRIDAKTFYIYGWRVAEKPTYIYSGSPSFPSGNYTAALHTKMMMAASSFCEALKLAQARRKG